MVEQIILCMQVQVVIGADIYFQQIAVADRQDPPIGFSLIDGEPILFRPLGRRLLNHGECFFLPVHDPRVDDDQAIVAPLRDRIDPRRIDQLAVFARLFARQGLRRGEIFGAQLRVAHRLRVDHRAQNNQRRKDKFFSPSALRNALLGDESGLHPVR